MANSESSRPSHSSHSLSAGGQGAGSLCNTQKKGKICCSKVTTRHFVLEDWFGKRLDKGFYSIVQKMLNAFIKSRARAQ